MNIYAGFPNARAKLQSCAGSQLSALCFRICEGFPCVWGLLICRRETGMVGNALRVMRNGRQALSVNLPAEVGKDERVLHLLVVGRGQRHIPPTLVHVCPQ